MAQVCDGCGEPPRLDKETGLLIKLRRCSRCHKTWYHDAECQRKHFKEHRKTCRQISKDRDTVTKKKNLSTLHSKKSSDTLKVSNMLLSLPSSPFTRLSPGYSVDSPVGNTHEMNMKVWNKANKLWMDGVIEWYNNQDYLKAMSIWTDSINCFVWDDNDLGFSPLGVHDKEQRIDLGRRLMFLSYCNLDANSVGLGRQLLIRSLQTLPRDEVQYISMVYKELMLTYEEEQNMAIAQRIASWAIQHKCCNWVDAFQRPGFVYQYKDGEGNSPFSSSTDFSWCQVLEEHWEVIRDEFFHLIDGNVTPSANRRKSTGNGKIRRVPNHWPKVGSGEHRNSGHDDHRVVSGSSGDWRELVLFGEGSQYYEGSAPRTKELLMRYVPDAVSLAEAGGGEVIFSILAPKTKIQPHCASTNIRLTAHLGLLVPTEDKKGVGKSESRRQDSAVKPPPCAIRVRDEWRTWQEGKVLLFDDSFEHEVSNETNECRAVLLIRFWNPAISTDERSAVLSDAINQKELDVRRRYNPPLSGEFSSAERRGMEKSACPRCFGKGYNSLRIVSNRSSVGAVFHCACGEPV